MNVTDSIILTSIGSIIAYIASKKWILPILIQVWERRMGKKKEVDDKNVDASNELLKYICSLAG